MFDGKFFQLILAFLIVLFQVGSKSCIFLMFSLTSDLLACLLSIRHLPPCTDGLDSFLWITLSPHCGFQGNVHIVSGTGKEFRKGRERSGTASILFFRRFVFSVYLTHTFQQNGPFPEQPQSHIPNRYSLSQTGRTSAAWEVRNLHPTSQPTELMLETSLGDLLSLISQTRGNHILNILPLCKVCISFHHHLPTSHHQHYTSNCLSQAFT